MAPESTACACHTLPYDPCLRLHIVPSTLINPNLVQYGVSLEPQQERLCGTFLDYRVVEAPAHTVEASIITNAIAIYDPMFPIAC